MRINNNFAALDWERFMARHDMVWTKAPLTWEEGAFLGNAMLGVLVYQDPDGQGLTLELGRSDVYDNRDPNAQGMPSLHDNGRLPIGKLFLKTAGKLTGFSMRLDLYRALLTGRLDTDAGAVDFEIYVHAVEMFFRVGLTLSGSEKASWSFVPAVSESPRQTFGRLYKDPRRYREGYEPNPPAELSEQDGCHTALQHISFGAGYVTCYRTNEDGTILYGQVNIGGDAAAVREESVRYILEQSGKDPAAQLAEHCAWWADYYRQSFVSIPDRRMESFYWIQMYKAACATRSGRLVMDNQGPWLVATSWPGTWWNLNVELAYSPFYTANRLGLTEAVWQNLQAHLDDLILNVPEHCRADSAAIHTSTARSYRSDCPAPGPENGPTAFAEIGNLTWVLHGCWQYYRMTMDQGYLREFLFPMLRRSVSYYLHYLEKREDGRYHLPLTSSPEYHENCEDCNYNLSLLYWGLDTLIRTAEQLSIPDEALPRWKEVLANLAPMPQDEDGYLIGAGVKYRKSHRHYSHLLMIYPLHLVSDEDGHKEIIERSIALWQSLPSELLGYSFTGAGSMYACMGDGDRSLTSLEKLWSQFLKPNTMYKESGPVIETPLAAAQTLNEMLLQSWGGRVRVFPAMPSHWKDACFVQLAAEGGFRVSAARKDGATRWIEVTSLAGEPLLLQTDLKGLRVLDNSHVTVEELPQPEDKPVHLYRIHGLGAGESAAFAGGEGPVEALEAFAADFTANPEYRYGLQDATEYNRAALSFDL